MNIFLLIHFYQYLDWFTINVLSMILCLVLCPWVVYTNQFLHLLLLDLFNTILACLFHVSLLSYPPVWCYRVLSICHCLDFKLLSNVLFSLTKYTTYSFVLISGHFISLIFYQHYITKLASRVVSSFLFNAHVSLPYLLYKAVLHTYILIKHFLILRPIFVDVSNL